MVIRASFLLLLAAPAMAQISPQAKQEVREEREQMDAQVDEDKLPIDISVLLGGKPFPAPIEYENPAPRPRRRIEIDESGDLNAALASLEPGDQLVLAPGAYEGTFTIGENCKGGTAEAPIQIFARGAVLRPAPDAKHVLRIDRAHWSIVGVQIVVADAHATALVVGSKAHDVVIEGAHLYNGLAFGLLIEGGSRGITIANSHIHHFGQKPQTMPTGIAITAGASNVTLVGNHLHHNRGASIGVLPGQSETSAARTLEIRGNKIHDDKAAAISLAMAVGVKIEGNKIYNYRAVGPTAGEAIAIARDSSEVTIEQNHFAEATVAVSADGVNGLSIRNNYLENRLTPSSSAFKVMSGSAVTIAHNVIDRYRDALVSPIALEFTHNVIIEPAGAVFSAEKARVESNVIGWDGESLLGAKAVKGVDLKDRDLAKLGVPAGIGIK